MTHPSSQQGLTVEYTLNVYSCTFMADALKIIMQRAFGRELLSQQTPLAI